MPFTDSSEETQVIFGEADITGSNSNKAAVLVAGVTPSNTGSFLKVSEDGELMVTGSFSADVSIAEVEQGTAGTQAEGWYARITDGSQVLGTGSGAPIYTSGSVHIQNFPSVQSITGSVGIVESVPLTIGSFSPNVTASVKVVASDIVQAITGTVGVNSIASPVTIDTITNAVTVTGSVVLGEQPIETTGTLGITEIPNVTIDSFVTTASVSIAETLITQSVVGNISIDNFPAVQAITGSVILGEQPINITGSATINSIISPVEVANSGFKVFNSSSVEIDPATEATLLSIKDTDGIKKITDALPIGDNVLGRTKLTDGSLVASLIADAAASLNRLAIEGKVSVVPSQAPSVATPVSLADDTPLSISTASSSAYVIPDGETFYLQTISAGSQGDPTEAGSKIEVLFDENGTERTIARLYVTGFTVVQSYNDVSQSRDETSLVGNAGGTNRIIIRRIRLSGASQEVDAELRGYVQ